MTISAQLAESHRNGFVRQETARDRLMRPPVDYQEVIRELQAAIVAFKECLVLVNGKEQNAH